MPLSKFCSHIFSNLCCFSMPTDAQTARWTEWKERPKSQATIAAQQPQLHNQPQPQIPFAPDTHHSFQRLTWLPSLINLLISLTKRSASHCLPHYSSKPYSTAFLLTHLQDGSYGKRRGSL
jgi:hypothetical protein